jgi:hypothetical protein
VRALWAVGWAALCAGCVSRLDLTDLDRLERSLEARTVVLERDYTLWSPFSVAQTKEWVTLVDEELAASRALLGAASGQRPLVVLVPVGGLGPQFEARGETHVLTAPAGHPLHGVNGRAVDHQVILYVTPDSVLQAADSRPVVSHRAAENYRATLRHELAHVHAFAAGIEGADWFNEGLAHLVCSYELEQGSLVDRGPPARELQAARLLPVESWSVARLLDWREDFARLVSGAEPVDEVSRSLCGLFVRFLAERAPPGSLVERLQSTEELTRTELEALEPEWRTWLSEAIACVEDSAPSENVGSPRPQVE